MSDKKWLTPILPYLAVWAGVYLFKDAWFALIGFHVAILLVLAIVRPNIPINSLFKSRFPQWVLMNVIFCSASGIGLYFLWDLFSVVPDLPAQLGSMGLNSPVSWFVFIAYFSLINPFIEEYFWRGVLGSNSKKLYIGDLVYAGYHGVVLWGKVPPSIILFALITLTSAGWFWRQSSREDEGLLAAVLGHLVADFSILLVVHWMCA
ncbi:MAG: CPBP family intramembrane metalloprotease [Chloroflexi bacterium]|nr:CPBP family intramembrane metalloprotease [Chloroflexota bacterium]